MGQVKDYNDSNRNNDIILDGRQLLPTQRHFPHLLLHFRMFKLRLLSNKFSNYKLFLLRFLEISLSDIFLNFLQYFDIFRNIEFLK